MASTASEEHEAGGCPSSKAELKEWPEQQMAFKWHFVLWAAFFYKFELKLNKEAAAAMRSPAAAVKDRSLDDEYDDGNSISRSLISIMLRTLGNWHRRSCCEADCCCCWLPQWSSNCRSLYVLSRVGILSVWRWALSRVNFLSLIVKRTT